MKIINLCILILLMGSRAYSQSEELKESLSCSNEGVTEYENGKRFVCLNSTQQQISQLKELQNYEYKNIVLFNDEVYSVSSDLVEDKCTLIFHGEQKTWKRSIKSSDFDRCTIHKLKSYGDSIYVLLNLKPGFYILARYVVDSNKGWLINHRKFSEITSLDFFSGTIALGGSIIIDLKKESVTWDGRYNRSKVALYNISNGLFKTDLEIDWEFKNRQNSEKTKSWHIDSGTHDLAFDDQGYLYTVGGTGGTGKINWYGQISEETVPVQHYVSLISGKIASDNEKEVVGLQLSWESGWSFPGLNHFVTNVYTGHRQNAYVISSNNHGQYLGRFNRGNGIISGFKRLSSHSSDVVIALGFDSELHKYALLWDKENQALRMLVLNDELNIIREHVWGKDKILEAPIAKQVDNYFIVSGITSQGFDGVSTKEPFFFKLKIFLK